MRATIDTSKKFRTIYTSIIFNFNVEVKDIRKLDSLKKAIEDADQENPWVQGNRALKIQVKYEQIGFKDAPLLHAHFVITEPALEGTQIYAYEKYLVKLAERLAAKMKRSGYVRTVRASILINSCTPFDSNITGEAPTLPEPDCIGPAWFS